MVLVAAQPDLQALATRDLWLSRPGASRATRDAWDADSAAEQFEAETLRRLRA